MKRGKNHRHLSQRRGPAPRNINRTRGQVWVETVIYTLIAFVMIGLVLSFVRPKIIEFQDKIIVDQSIGIMDSVHNVVLSLAQGGSGNKRVIPDLRIEKGTLKIDGTNGENKIIFEMESRYKYSEPGTPIKIGKIDALTEEVGDFNNVMLTLNYEGEYDVQYKDQDILFTISRATTPYTLSIENKGGDPPIMNFEIS